MNERKNATYKDQDILIADDPSGRVRYGPGLRLVNCQVEVRTDAGAIGLSRVEMANCTVTAKRPVEKINFTGVRFDKCRFVGEFVNCDFGHQTDPFDYGGALIECDFTAAQLDQCRFFDSKLRAQKMRSAWPQVVLAGNFQAEAKARLPSANTIEEKVFFGVLADAEAEQSASLRWGPKLAQRMNMSEEQLLAFLDTLPFVYRGN